MESELKKIQISEPLLQLVMHEYIEGLRKRKSTSERAQNIQLLWETQTDFYNSACQAMTQAIVFSTLAGVALNQEDFEREADSLFPIDDVELSALRSDIFKNCVYCTVSSIGAKTAEEMNIPARIKIFDKKTSSMLTHSDNDNDGNDFQ